MYCFRCGKKLPGREINCPDCDTPQKKRKRRHRRMILGLFIFLSGAFAGSIFDTYLFKGEAWKHSFLNRYFADKFGSEDLGNSADKSDNPSSKTKIEVKYSDNNQNENKKSNGLEKTDVSLPSTSPALLENKAASSIESPTASSNNNENSVSTKNEQIDKSYSLIDSVPPEISNVLSEAPSGVSDITNNHGAKGISSEIAVEEYDDFESVPAVQTGEIANDKVIVDEVEDIAAVTLDNSLNGSTKILFSETEPIQEIGDSMSYSDKEGELVFKNVALLESVNGDSYHAFLSKDRKELVFASNRLPVNGKSLYQCFVKQTANNSDAERAFEWNGNVWTPELTPDGNMIVFSSDSTKPEHIFLYDRKSGKSMALTSGRSKNMMPSISQDGKKVVFVSNRGDGKNRIWVLDLFNPAKIVQITNGEVNDREPRWSADGKSIVFTRIKVNMKDSKIMRVNIDDIGNPIELVSSSERNWMPSLSPDGKILAFTRSLNAGGSHNAILLKNLESSKEEVLAFPGIFDCFRPVWNSDGLGFVFHASRKSGKCLYQANFSRK